MDWGAVSLSDLCESLCEVDLRAPRPLREFLLAPKAFLPPQSVRKWVARLKCNAHHYISNYLAILLLSFVVCFIRNPRALAGLMITATGLLCLNEPFFLGIK